MGREFELKYKATPARLEAIRAQFGGFHTIEMETTYYDIPSRLLRELHWTLRRRMENGVSVCTVKTDLENGGRGEWEMACADIGEAIPALIAMGAPAELAEYTADGVIATCGARFTRQAATVPAGSSTVEIALDQGVLLGGGRELPLCEVEVELKSGTDQDAVDFAAALAETFSLTPEPQSKLRRALSLAD